MINQNMTLGNIVQLVPESTRILRSFKLDFCCGGEQSLEQACKDKKINTVEVLKELSSLQELKLEDDSMNMPLDKLTDFIVKRFHEDLRKRIPELILLASRVERVHCDSPNCPKGLSSFLRFLMTEMENHMQKEEQLLFPMINRGQGKMAMMPVECMKNEHLEHGKNLERLRELANQFIVPEGACTTWKALYAGLDQLEEEIMTHIHLENHVLFVRCLK